MKTGVVDVGGGLRGVYTAGVFDYCLDHLFTEYPFRMHPAGRHIKSPIAETDMRGLLITAGYIKQ